MAEAKVEVAVDVSNRPYLVYQVKLASTQIGSFDAALTEDFLYAFSQNAGLDLHVEPRLRAATRTTSSRRSSRAWRARCAPALERDPRVRGLPTVKGAL